ncbi:MAG: glycoside hydrolase 43 family protein [Bacteroidetes bacterium]|nr:glycoside hydrolase 43 family protein [Bacteroidota bacterium]MCB0843146.1 glycoside hydrolase 43 family protein [Bacteroidota bacterium]
MRSVCFLFLISIQIPAIAQVWEPDNGDGTYKNPVIYADYSDPDVVRVGDDFYMTASSFNCAPALPVLHSKDLVNWKIINHVFLHQPPADVFDKPQHGNGVWAPSIRYYGGWFYVFYGDPDFGIYMCKTQDPAGQWEPPHLVKAAKGWIDPCPFWDDDGKAYLVHAFAGSRAGVKSVVVLHEMAPDASRLLDDGVIVFDGHENHPTIEGTKMHKRNGYYYILAPGGGVATGWQTVLRSKNVFGPYEDKIVLHQGNTDINGPHQGAWVELANGDDWFIHFQEKQPYGRIVHLQPARWENDWLMIGEDKNKDGIGEPVASWKKPDVEKIYPSIVPQTSDEFNTPHLGLQWQWQANPEPTWMFPTPNGFLRMNPVIMPDIKNLWDAPNLLLQKMPAETFTVTTKLTFHHHFDGEKTGLVIMGRDYSYLALEQQGDKLVLQQVTCIGAENGKPESVEASVPLKNNEIMLRVKVKKGGLCQFAYSPDGKKYTDIGKEFKAREGKWIGAKVGIFCIRPDHNNDGGYADYDWFRIEK